MCCIKRRILRSPMRYDHPGLLSEPLSSGQPLLRGHLPTSRKSFPLIALKMSCIKWSRSPLPFPTSFLFLFSPLLNSHFDKMYSVPSQSQSQISNLYFNTVKNSSGLLLHNYCRDTLRMALSGLLFPFFSHKKRQRHFLVDL